MVMVVVVKVVSNVGTTDVLGSRVLELVPVIVFVIVVVPIVLE